MFERERGGEKEKGKHQQTVGVHSEITHVRKGAFHAPRGRDDAGDD